MEKDIYKRRVREALKKKGLEVCDTKLDLVVDEYTEKGIPPSVAVMKGFSLKDLKHGMAQKKFEPILAECCESFGLSIEDAKTGYTKDWRNLRSIACYIAVEKLDIRPHTVMRDMLGLANNGMVRHKVYRANRLLDENVLFAEKLLEIQSNLDL